MTTDDWTPSALELDRAAYRKRRRARSNLIAFASTLAVVAVVAIALVTSPGWTRFHETFFDPAHVKSSFGDVLKGLWLNIRIMVGCGIAIAIWSTCLAVMRTTRSAVTYPLRLFATAYVDLFRGLPLLLVILLLGFGVPALELSGLTTSLLFWGCVSIVLSYAAYVAEVLRAGIESIHPSQRAAARSLGLSYGQSLRYVVMPQAVRRVIPALMNDLVSLQKDSGLISVLGVIDAIRAAQIRTSLDFNYTPYVVAGALFVCLTIPMARFTDWYARKQGFQGAGGML